MKMKVAQLQTRVYPEKEKNLDQLQTLLDRIHGEKPDLVTLGEMFTCPYVTENFPKYAEPEGGPTWQCLSTLAKEYGVYLSAGSIPIRDDAGHVYNSAYVFDRDGKQIARHDKVHLFDIYLKNGEVIGENANYFGCTAERIAPEFGGALFIKKEALEKSGGWSPDTIACEEAELHARLKAHKLLIAELPVNMIIHTDAVREDRGVLGVVFSRRRLGEGQALRCAMVLGQADAYIHHENEKFLLYSIDWMCVILIALLGVWGGLGALFFPLAQLGRFLSRRRIRAFVSQKLFFFAFPAGLLSYRVRSRAYEAA